MKSRTTPFIILFVVVLAGYFLNKWYGFSRKDDPETAVRTAGFDRRVSTLEYAPLALCQMDCRKISKTDVEDIMRTGEINYAMSNMSVQPCPTYAVQGYSAGGQNLRIVFAQCEKKTQVVTCYNLQKEVECSCPGDENQKQH